MKEKTLKLVERLRALGCDDPELWTRSEMSENIAQFTRLLFLRTVWEEDIDYWMNDPDDRVAARIRDKSAIGIFAKSASAVSRMKAAGVTSEDICTFARYVAYATAFNVINRVDEENGHDASTDAPGWRLMETDSKGELTGRNVGGLHENLLSLNPDGDC
jgi:hypothetical protein